MNGSRVRAAIYRVARRLDGLQGDNGNALKDAACGRACVRAGVCGGRRKGLISKCVA